MLSILSYVTSAGSVTDCSAVWTVLSVQQALDRTVHFDKLSDLSRSYSTTKYQSQTYKHDKSVERSVNLSWGSGITLSKSTTPHSYHGVRRTRTTIRYKYESRSFPCSLKFSGFQPKDKSFSLSSDMCATSLWRAKFTNKLKLSQNIFMEIRWESQKITEYSQKSVRKNIHQMPYQMQQQNNIQSIIFITTVRICFIPHSGQ